MRKAEHRPPTNDERIRARELRDRAREMRASPTDTEARLWSMLRGRRMPGVKFRRQHVIAPFIADFACPERWLIVEADGSQHATSPEDRRRDAYLRQRGWTVLRFWNNDVLNNAFGVFKAIYAALHTPHPPKPAAWAPPSPLLGEGQE